MDKDAIDWDLVVQDPDYRRLVIAKLNAAASREGEREPAAAPAQPETPPAQTPS
ncbi:MAG TPA: hypothetical protein VKY65_13425 [Alphaproteobacteria bacterium]|nr:hypothetical protein [Alphaproteobacteria bacterium]